MAFPQKTGGVSIIQDSYKYTPSDAGVSIVSDSFRYVPSDAGVSIVSDSNLTVNFVNDVTNLPLFVTALFSNVTFTSDIYTNGTSSPTSSSMSLRVVSDSTIRIEVNQVGYNPFSQDYVIDSDIDTTITVRLVPIANVQLTCDTYFITDSGQKLEVYPKNARVKLETTFTITSFVQSEWVHVMTVFPVLGDDESCVEIPAGYISTNGNSVVFRSNDYVTKGDGFYYISSIRKKLC